MKSTPETTVVEVAENLFRISNRSARSVITGAYITKSGKNRFMTPEENTAPNKLVAE